MQKLRLLSLLALLAIVAVTYADEEVTNGQVAVNVRGKSGRISFWLPGREDKQFGLGFESLCETDGGECVDSFDDQQFNFSNPENVKFQGISCTRISFDSAITTKNQTGVNFEAELYLFHEDGNYTVGQQTFVAMDHTFKWSFNISGWVFSSNSSRLELSMSLRHPNNGSRWLSRNESLSSHHEEEEDGNTLVEFAKTATYDGTTEGDVEVRVSSDGPSVEIVFSFAAAQSSIWYDPQVTVAAGSSAASTASSFLFSFVHTLLW